LIETIHAQLSAWGRWVIRAESRSHGFPPICPMFRDSRAGRGNYSSGPVIEMGSASASEAINKIVAGLSRDRRVLCAEYYVVQGRHCDIAKRMGIHPDTLHKQMHRMQEAVRDAMCCESFAGKGEK